MSDALRKSVGSIGTTCYITIYAEEIEKLIIGNVPPPIIKTDETIEVASVFALEKHLENFLVQNRKQTELGKNYDVYETDGEIIGRQYQIDTGFIDILAISKDKKELLVVELKKGRASDSVVGQIQRFVRYVLAEPGEEVQIVKGAILALEDDIRIRRGLAVTPKIEFYRYQINFKHFKN
jgi:restriction system protein